MTRWILLALLLAACDTTGLLAEETEPAPSDRPCSAPENRQFDFWIGDWVVTRPDRTPAGVNRIQLILDGCVLHESWEGVEGSRGQSFTMYYRPDQRWHQTWVDAGGGRLDLAGGIENGVMVLRGETPGGATGTTLHEITWTPLAGGRVRQRWRSSQDGGESWSEVFLGLYSPRQPAPRAPRPDSAPPRG